MGVLRSHALAAVAALLLASPATAGSRDIATALKAMPESAWVPFEVENGQMRVPVLLNGKAVSAVFDTGASEVVIPRDYAKANGIATKPGPKGIGIGGTFRFNRAGPQTIGIAGIEIRIAEAFVPDSNIFTQSFAPLIIGRAFLDHVALEIDFASKRMRFLRSPAARQGFVAIPLTLKYGIPHIAIDIGSIKAISAGIDTGAFDELRVNEALWRAAGPADAPFTDGEYGGLGGTYIARHSHFPAIGFAGQTMTDIDTIIDPAEVDSDLSDRRVSIGLALLARFDVIFDLPARSLLLRPRPAANIEPVIRTRAGITFDIRPDRLIVDRVLLNSPAMRAGWKIGDAICAIDGTAIPADYKKSALRKWSYRAAGTEAAFRMCDGTQRSLTLADFY